MPSLRVSLMITLLSKTYFEKVIGLLEQMNIAELVPTEELVELFTACLDSNCKKFCVGIKLKVV